MIRDPRSVLVLDGHELALGPLEQTLVRAVIAAATAMRREPTFEVRLHVARGSVRVAVVRFLDLGIVRDGQVPD